MAFSSLGVPNWQIHNGLIKDNNSNTEHKTVHFNYYRTHLKEVACDGRSSSASGSVVLSVNCTSGQGLICHIDQHVGN